MILFAQKYWVSLDVNHDLPKYHPHLHSVGRDINKYNESIRLGTLLHIQLHYRSTNKMVKFLDLALNDNGRLQKKMPS